MKMGHGRGALSGQQRTARLDVRPGIHTATIVNSRGGYLHEGNATIYCGVEDEDVQRLLDLVRETCQARTRFVTPLPPVMELGELHLPDPVEKQLGGASVFVWSIERVPSLLTPTPIFGIQPCPVLQSLPC